MSVQEQIRAIMADARSNAVDGYRGVAKAIPNEYYYKAILDMTVEVEDTCRDLFRCGGGMTVALKASCRDKCQGKGKIKKSISLREILKERGII